MTIRRNHAAAGLPERPSEWPQRAWIEVPTRGTYVYRLLDASGAVVYVGCSARVRARLKVHQRSFEFDWVELEGPFKERSVAEDRERDLIETLRPRHNRAGIDYLYRRHPRPVAL